MIRKALIIILLLGGVAGCRGRSTSGSDDLSSGDAPGTEAVREVPTEDTTPAIPPSTTLRKLDSMGLIRVAELDSTIAVHLKYATPNNFVGEVMYDDLTEAYLLPEPAQKMAEAQRLLREQYPGYRLIIYDAARPMSVQRKMWQVAVKQGKQYYVANPSKGGGLHNYGAAVDVSILDENGTPLPMGTAYDHLGPEANIDREEELLHSGKITETELANRLLLRGIMRQVGFRTVTSEWWHFNWVGREEAKARYALIDF